jgi:spermidine/putrescine transport system substrate-binding protein
MLTKLRTNPGAYDVVLINSAYTAQAHAEGLLAPIDPAKISNFADLDPSLTGNEDLNPGGALHGVPWTWGLTALPHPAHLSLGPLGPGLQGQGLDPR